MLKESAPAILAEQPLMLKQCLGFIVQVHNTKKHACARFSLMLDLVTNPLPWLMEQPEQVVPLSPTFATDLLHLDMTTRFYHGLALLPGRRSPPLIFIVRLWSQGGTEDTIDCFISGFDPLPHQATISGKDYARCPASDRCVSNSQSGYGQHLTISRSDVLRACRLSVAALSFIWTAATEVVQTSIIEASGSLAGCCRRSSCSIFLARLPNSQNKAPIGWAASVFSNFLTPASGCQRSLVVPAAKSHDTRPSALFHRRTAPPSDTPALRHSSAISWAYCWMAVGALQQPLQLLEAVLPCSSHRVELTLDRITQQVVPDHAIKAVGGQQKAFRYPDVSISWSGCHCNDLKTGAGKSASRSSQAASLTILFHGRVRLTTHIGQIWERRGRCPKAVTIDGLNMSRQQQSMHSITPRPTNHRTATNSSSIFHRNPIMAIKCKSAFNCNLRKTVVREKAIKYAVPALL
ncbi:hypothetical protein T06_857 [Trichinella sp. T6]|nr:hypothetical protein T06_857 [Trichinella sp. T6]